MKYRKNLEVVARELAQNRLAYLAFLKEIKAAAEQVGQKFGLGFVRQIYSRGEKQLELGLAFEDEEFKSPPKLAQILTDEDNLKLNEIDDVVGLTVVVLYPDQINFVVEHISNKIKGIAIIAHQKQKTLGYHATHVVYKSTHPDWRDVRCEMQVKTMLQDAWAWKTHDLTYKPKGNLDDRLKNMMGMFSDAIQAIEQQSVMLRDVIQDRWLVENHWRKAVRDQLLDSLPHETEEVFQSFDGKELRAKMSSLKEHLRTANKDDETLIDIRKRIKTIAAADPFEEYLLEARLTIIRDTQQDRERAITCVWRCLDNILPDHCSEDEKSHLVWGIPLVLQVCGDLESAIRAGNILIDDPVKYPFSTRARSILQFNLANHLIENAYLSKLHSLPNEIELKDKIRQLLDSSASLFDEDKSAYYDADGMFDIMFAKDASSIKAGMAKLTKGKETLEALEQQFAENYYVYNAGIAWQRLREEMATELRPQTLKRFTPQEEE